MPRKKRRRKKDEEIIQQRSPEKTRELIEMNLALNKPLMAETILQLQQSHGNRYVQHMLRQRQQEEMATGDVENGADTQASERLSHKTEYPMRTKGHVTKNGELALDLKHAIHMERYSKTSRDFRHQLARWQGLGEVEIEKEKFLDDRLNVATDGRCQMQLGESFLDQLSKSNDPNNKEDRAPLQFGQEFDVNMKATLHYRSQDQRLQDTDVAQASKLFDPSKNKNGFFLKIEIESIVVNRIDGKPQEKEMRGTLILQGVVTDS